MPSKYTHDVVATTGTYKNHEGQEKKEFTNVGKAFTGDDGRISILLKTVPVGPNWSGWLSLYPAKERDGQAPRPNHPADRTSGDEEETIPF